MSATRRAGLPVLGALSALARVAILATVGALLMRIYAIVAISFLELRAPVAAL